MKFSAVLAVAATASAASLQKKQSQTLEIDSFYGDCIAHSTQCSYGFEVVSDPALPPSHCNALVPGPDNLPEVTNGSCSDNVAYTWTITKVTDGLNFAIGYPFSSRSNITYCHSIPSSEITSVNDGTANPQHYSGPSNFTATIC